MNQEFALELIRQMVAIPSVSGDEAAVAAYVAEQMQRLGYRSHVDAAGNAVGEIGSADGRLILLLGHLDTVPGSIAVRQQGRKLYGRGSVDAKGSLATFICAAAAGVPEGRLVVVGAVEEETYGSRGARYVLDRYSPDAVLIGEPSGWSNVTLGYKGQLGIRYSVFRPQVHEASGGDNAAALAAELWFRLQQYLAAIDPEKSVFYRPVPSLRRFDGDAERAQVRISCRLPPAFDLAALQDFLHHAAGDGELELSGLTPAVVVERTAPTVRSLLGAIRRQGGDPGLRIKTGTSDMNTVSERWRVPMAAYGPGDSSLDHTPHEHLDLDEYLRAIAVLGDALPVLAAELTDDAPATADDAPAVEDDTPAAADDAPPFTDEEEEELAARLRALGYIS